MPEGEHFTPEMLDRNEHPHDPKYRQHRNAVHTLNELAARVHIAPGTSSRISL